jgi:hypothetical protein
MGGTSLKNFMPDVYNNQMALSKTSDAIKGLNGGFVDTMKGKFGSNVQGAMQYYGIEQLYFDWLRQAYSYRRMFIQDLYMIAFDSAEIRTPLMWLKNEVFRKGFDSWVPNFFFKCNECGKEFNEKVTACECGSISFREPDPDQYKEFDTFKLKCNIFGQSLEEVLRTLSDDLNIADDGYLFLNKRYGIFNRKLFGKVEEIRRLHPALMEFDLDKHGLPKNSHWMCPFHRTESMDAKPGLCPVCHIETKPVMYIYNHRGLKIYFFEDEIIHLSKFSPSETYGYSPLLTVMQKVLTISGMDKYLYRYFFERKTPTQMILTNTDDPQSLELERARIESKMAEDPTYTPWIAVSQKSGRGRTDVVKLWHTLQEMDYLPVRNEIRDRISAIYGVPQMYMNVMEGVGGISGQSQQLKVFSSVIQSDQRMYNQKLLPQIYRAFGITDWRINLRPPEEKIEGEILTLATQKVQIASSMSMLGFDVKLKSGCKDIDTLDFTFSGEAINQAKQQAEMGEMQMAQGEQQIEQGDQAVAAGDQQQAARDGVSETLDENGQPVIPEGPNSPPIKDGAVGPRKEGVPQEPILNAGQQVLPQEEKVFNDNDATDKTVNGKPQQKTYEDEVFNP